MKKFLSMLIFAGIFLLSSFSYAFANHADERPDLIVDDIRIETSRSYLTYDIKNNSDYGVDASQQGGHTYIYIDDMENPARTYSWSTIANTDFFNGNGMSTGQPQTLRGEHVVKICVDPNDVVNESNELNNCLTKTVNEGDGQNFVDMQVYSIDVIDDTLTVEIKNDSYFDIPANVSAHTYIYIDDMINPAWTYSWSTLADRGFYEAYGRGTIAPQTLIGEHVVKVCVDPNNVIEEANEYDNCKTVTVNEGDGVVEIAEPEPVTIELPTITVTTDPVVEAELFPDLVIEDIYLNRSRVTVLVHNQGDAVVNPYANGYTHIYIDDMINPAYSYSWGDVDHFFMRVGGSSTLQPELIYGNHVVKACVDPYDVVDEIYEYNNCRVTTLRAPEQVIDVPLVEYPDLVIDNIYLESDGTLSVVVQNESGSAVDGSINGYTSIYIDDMYEADWSYSWSTLDDRSFLNSYGTSVLQPQVLYGRHTVKACVDSYYAVYESDEGNNCQTFTLNGADEELPDLQIQKLEKSENGKLDIYIENVSGVEIDADLDGQIYIYSDDMDNARWAYSWDGIGETDFREPYGLNVLHTSIETEEHLIKVCVDALDALDEGNESNNCYSRYFYPAEEGTSVSVVYEEEIALPEAGFEDEVITNFEYYLNPFSDTNVVSLEGMAASELYRRGIIGGYDDGEFKGWKPVNRAETAKFLLLARYGYVNDVDENYGLIDVVVGQWYTKFVVTAYVKGIMAGYPSGLFLPANNVNTVEFLKMLTNAFALPTSFDYSYIDVPEDAWFSKFAGVAEEYDLFPNRDEGLLSPGSLLDRDEIAVAIYQYLRNR